MSINTIVDIKSIPIVLQTIQKAQDEILNATGVKVYLNIAVDPACDGQLRRMKIRNIVCTYYATTWEEIITKSRKKEVVEPRFAYIYLCITRLGASLSSLQREFAYTDHTSIIHARNTMQGYVDTNQPHGDRIKDMNNILNQDA